MLIELHVSDGPHQGKKFSFTEHETFLVGRCAQAHFQLSDKDTYISRIHFMIEVNPPLCRLVDMKSQNGTFVNGQKVKTADLQDGDRIKLGQTEIGVAITDTDSPSEEHSATVDYRPRAAHAEGAAPAEAATSQPDSFPTIEGYRIRRELGRGSMGVVYLAVSERDNETVALKTIIPSRAGSRVKIERFLREAEILQGLSHPHIVAFRDSGMSNGRIFFAMDFVPGASAGRLLKQNGPLPVSLAVRLLYQLLQALEYAHGEGIVHRDIKPENILVPRIDGRRIVKLTDFGLARAYRASQLSGLTIHGNIGGTIPFMPPEQILSFRQVQPPTDQYSAAASLYRLLTGKYVHDFPGDTVDALSMILDEPPVPVRERRPDIPGRLAEVIHRALQKKPEDRYPSVRKMRQALKPFVK